jgi:hypothetical protein
MHHWEVVVASGAIPFIVDLADKLFEWKMPRKYYAIFLGIGLVLAMFLSWDEEHHNFSAADTSRQTAVTNYTQCDSERTALRALNDSYSSQLANQQGTINTCVVTLAKVAVPETPKITTRGYIFESIHRADPTDKAAVLVATTNRDVSSFKGSLNCPTPFELYEVVLSEGIMSITPGIKSGGFHQQVDLDFANSNWRTGDFIFVLLHGANLDPQKCSITSR